MTTYATGNPLGSKDPRDLYDNAENFDAAMNDRENLAWSDRFGVSRKTWFGVEQQVNDFLIGTAFEPVPLIYVDGSELVVPSPSKLIQRDGNLYSVRLPANFPVTLSGNWAADELLLTVRSDQALRQQLRDAGGSGMVGFNASESYLSDTVGYEVKTLGALKVVVVTNYGATGNGTTDDTAAIQAAIAAAGPYSDVVFPSGTYLITSTLTSLTGQRWLGRGGQRGTTIKKGANIDMVVVGTLSTILDINLEGVGATYTGKGFRIVSGFSQTITRCRAVNMGGNPMWFDVDAGGGANVTCFEGYPVDPDAYAGIQIAGDTGAHPRFFRGIWLSGANFALGPGAGNGGSLSEFYIRTFVFDPTSTLFHISNGRCSTPSTTIRGFDHSIDGVAFPGPLTLDSAQGINFGPSCGINNNFAEVNSQYNAVYIQRRTYTPTWVQSTATPSIGNGTLTGNFVRSGHMCHLQLELIAGSTTTFGDSASAYRFSLPFPAHLSFNQRGFPVRIFDTSAGADFTGWVSIPAGSTEFTISFGAQSVRASSPMTWANGDTLQCSFSYMVR
ncbi:glycosyl hydrolase family 28-related protein [Pseudomonas aeruginosa]|uniref:glycosyl hydrolase family 28-related protein n=1 Tax=Pseudomonas aeruginosa TaxID=287 RepID=UPI002359AC92|nr:glycosyl hydrolase family 28-related protein [Pseudomonas aeruginosa]WEO50463.1 glycosyl hydrolase family 28-related protein [Pseudomonas aeruginosa]